MGLNILIVSPEPWDTNQVSKHHYARTLAKRGHRVLFLDPPGPSGSTQSIERVLEEDGEILIVRGPRVAPGLRFMPGSIRRALERRWLERLERRVGVHVDIVWQFENSRFYDMTFAGDRVKIYHQVDLNQDRHMAAAAESADIRFAVSEVILNQIAKHALDVRKISHGVLTVELRTGTECPRIRPGRPTAAYVGSLDIMYLDAEALRETVLGSPEVDFHLIGSYSENGKVHRLIHALPNAFFWGRLPSKDLPEVLEKMDVLMLVYDSFNHRDQVANPHKLMEYLASGKVTVATHTEEYKSLSGELVVMVDKLRDYPAAFRAVMADLNRWNSPALRAARIAYALDNTYDRQLDRISSALSQCDGIRDRIGEIRL
jgi:glycosyltransferase involved in cell wall biosynthesis